MENSQIKYYAGRAFTYCGKKEMTQNKAKELVEDWRKERGKEIHEFWEKLTKEREKGK